MTIITRFAPSPNGSLHLGHALSAIVAHDRAKADGGRFLLRIEDIDGGRSRPELAAEFRADLAWLGLEWEEVRAQSTRIAHYDAAAEELKAQGLLYPCDCTRAQILAADPVIGPEGPIYPGTCREKHIDPHNCDGPVAWRLDVAQANRKTGPLIWEDELAGPQTARPEMLGDVVLLRKDPDTPASYHLAATLDDAADGINMVTRGMDLFSATHVHRLLQALLGLPVPRWHHHSLLLDEQGRKLAKRRHSPSLADRRLAGEDGRALAAALRAGQLPTGISCSK
ncbi:tRNA glutamyl-Q(34) synthetase GluQRS [Altericroceibacterium endophyticum]|uniref:tRNA glutamyl-Q(34) synthetase GluQRS n=1 Tax=Altericroceibacterium endophyticum TaxID=1808508 RepID=A0A6I4T3J0_9SPHN|nr:tRNA glutamyl-Q(34) synthetase GluQRS [Altericroceibacterium endophyticum]MXO65467.1 tRNA glutamyl-Q(34) synthetase GluQRS [Altericroceibacterium endophyticum]